MNIIVNGGTSGIGKEIVLVLAREKSNMILVTGRNDKILKQLSSEGKYKNVTSVMIDLLKFEDQEKSFFTAVSSRMKSVDILINTAGYLVVGEFMKFSNRNAREMMETNFFGPALVIKTLCPLMRKGAHIVNISSMGGYQGSAKYKGLSYYSASKAAISCLSECLAAELSDKGISVNCLALGAVQTEMFEEAFPGLRAPVTAGEIAEFIADFALNGNKFFNGKVLPVAVGNP
jgi:short-subunit dehydrogenase